MGKFTLINRWFFLVEGGMNTFEELVLFHLYISVSV